jgi:MFS family permease
MVAVAFTCRPENRTRSFALIRLAANLGMSIGPAIGGILAAHHYGWLFLGDALTCSAAAVFVLVVLGRSPDQAPENTTAPSQRHTTGSGSPWSDLPFLGFCLLVVCMATALFQIWTTFPLFLRSSYHLPETTIGLVIALNAAIIVVFEMPLLRLMEGRRLMPFIVWGSFLTCLGMGLLPFGTGVAMAVLSTAVWTLGEMLALPLTNTIVAERATPGTTGRYMGLFTLTFSVAFIIAPVIGTTIYDHLGARVLWLGVACFGVLLALGFAALAPHIEGQRSAKQSE